MTHNGCRKIHNECFEKTIYHKILDIGHAYYLMQEDKSQEEFLNQLRADESVRTQRIIKIIELAFDEYDCYLARKGLPRDHFKEQNDN